MRTIRRLVSSSFRGHMLHVVIWGAYDVNFDFDALCWVHNMHQHCITQTLRNKVSSVSPFAQYTINLWTYDGRDYLQWASHSGRIIANGSQTNDDDASQRCPVEACLIAVGRLFCEERLPAQTYWLFKSASLPLKISACAALTTLLRIGFVVGVRVAHYRYRQQICGASSVKMSVWLHIPLSTFALVIFHARCRLKSRMT